MILWGYKIRPQNAQIGADFSNYLCKKVSDAAGNFFGPLSSSGLCGSTNKININNNDG